MSDTIRPLIKQSLTPQRLTYKPCVIVMGRTGVGKTTLVNALCDTAHEAGAGAGSVTRELYRNDVNCGNYPFSLIDTPGTDSTSEAYKHAFLLRKALTATLINTVFIVIKYDNRFDRLVQNYLEVEEIVYKYQKKVVIMISHWDNSRQPDSEFQSICKELYESCPDVRNIIAYSERSSPLEVAHMMYACVSNMDREAIQITDEEFLLKFNIADIKLRIKRYFDEYLKAAKKLLNDYSEAAGTTKSESLDIRDEILHLLIVEFKNEMEGELTKFREKHGASMQELDFYTFYIKMQKENVRLCDEFLGKVIPLMSYNLFDNGDPRNLIKQCPHCQEIWFKTEGCDGQTTCGNRKFSNYFDLKIKPPWKFFVKRIDGKVKWEKTQPAQMTMKKEAATSKGKGCGASLKWSELPKLDEALILDLFKVKTMDEVKELFKCGSFRGAREQYEANIDTSFHS